MHLGRHRRQIAGAAAGAIAAVCAAALPGDAASIAAKGWNAPVLVSASKASRETSYAINPVNERVMFLCDPSGVPALNERQSFFHRSTDAGRTWAPLKVETAGTDTRGFAFEGGDCDVAFDAGGTMYAADTWVGNLSVGHSKDNGATWDGGAITTSAPIVDRPWLVGGPKGTVYLSFHDLQCCSPSVMWFTKSTDYGKTFSPAVPVTTANADGSFTWEGNFVVSPSGRDIYLAYFRRATPGFADEEVGGETVWLAVSHDGGATFTSHKVATLQHRVASIYPSVGLDAGGRLHLVYSAPGNDDVPIWYTTSRDKGVTWTAPRALSPGTVGYAPWVVGGKAGQAAIVWLGSPNADEDVDEPDWYFYWTRVSEPRAGQQRFATGRTTTRPLFSGSQTAPEFEMVRLDKQGRMHIGMSIFRTNDSGRNAWAVYYQRETNAR